MRVCSQVPWSPTIRNRNLLHSARSKRRKLLDALTAQLISNGVDYAEQALWNPIAKLD